LWILKTIKYERHILMVVIELHKLRWNGSEVVAKRLFSINKTPNESSEGYNSNQSLIPRFDDCRDRKGGEAGETAGRNAPKERFQRWFKRYL
jgi:hypothetical protein